MIRALVKFSTTRTPKTNSYFILRNRTCDLFWLNAPSVYSYGRNKCICSDPVGNNLLKSSTFNVIKEYVRFKSKDKKSRIRQDDSDDEEDNENSVDEYDEDGNKVRQIKVKSMRADNILGKCMALTKRKIDESFLESKFRHNGQPLPKKSLELKPGDSLELCTDPVDTGGTTEVISKVNILKIKPLEETSTYLLTYSIEKIK